MLLHGAISASSTVPSPSSVLPAPSLPRHSLAKAGSSLVVSGDRDPETVAFETEMVAFFVDAAELLGVPKSVAAIYGIVFASPEPLSFSEIEERLVVSKGSVSQGLRVLREVGAIKEASVSEVSASNSESQTSNSDLQSPKSVRAYKGRDRFVPDMELRKLVKHFLETRLQSQLESGSGRLEQLEANIPTANPEYAALLRDRTKYLSSWNKKARALMPIAKTFLKLS